MSVVFKEDYVSFVSCKLAQLTAFFNKVLKMFMCCTKTQLSLGVLCGLEWTVTRISFWIGMVTLIGSICYDFKVKHQFCWHFDFFSLSFKTFQRNFHFLQEKNSMKTCFGLQTFLLNSSFILVCALQHFIFPQSTKTFHFLTLNFFVKIRIYSFKSVWWE